jgi:uncharacterized membrane protein
MNNNIKPDRRFFFRIDAHYRLMIALAVAAIVLFFTYRQAYAAPITILLVWIAFALTVIVLNWIVILSSHPREVQKIARLQDSSRTILFLFTIVASLMSLGAILLLLSSTKGHGGNVTSHILLAMASVIVSWWLVHTIFTLRYAHMFYDTDTDDGGTKPFGGLRFPRDIEPDYLDFVYFSFVIGMTFQVSDIEITKRDIRRLAWMHGLISFAFNTAIVALSINIISSLI